jgi:hypothetical protein
MGALFDGFVNPGLAIGAGLAIVPLIIHLLNRQRHRPMRWAAMRFVMAAYRRTQRRARMENLLLLLLRMGAVALLALAIARPFAGERSPLAGMTETRRDLVLVLDGSASTGYREQLEGVFEKTVARAREIVLGMDGGRGDRVRLILAGAWPRLLSWRSPEEALDLLGTLSSPTDEALDFGAALGEIVRYAEEDAAGTGQAGLEVRVLTDLQRNSLSPSFDAPEQEGAETAANGSPTPSAARTLEQLDRLRELGLRVLIEDLGPPLETPPNLAITAVEPTSPLLGPGTSTDISVEVANFGPNLKVGVRVWIEVDGQRQPHESLEVPARGRARAVFPVVFRTRGAKQLLAHIESDRLPADDVRALVLTVPPAVRVLLVNGAPSADDIEQDEVGILEVVLQPPQSDDLTPPAQSPFVVTTVEPRQLSATEFDFSEYDVLWLANVASLAQGTVLKIEQRVAAGAALIVSLGNRVQRQTYNSRLFRPDGSGLLPAELLENVAVASRDQNYFRAHEFDETHPVLSFFADERWKPLLTEMPFFEFAGTRPLADARVLARFDDSDESALLIERSYDRGRVFLFTSTIDDAWTFLPRFPRTLVPLVHEWLRYAGRPEEPRRNVAVGHALEALVEKIPSKLTLTLPDGSRRTLPGEAQPGGQGIWRLPAVTDTQRAGLYQIEVEVASSALPLSVPFAVQIDPREGDLDRLAPAEVAAIHPGLVLVGSNANERNGREDDGPQKGELWRWLAGLCLAFLVGESLWAAWLGARRRLP